MLDPTKEAVASSSPSPPLVVGPGLLARFLGSEAAAQRWRRNRDLREREQLRADLARDLCELARLERRPVGESAALTQAVRQLETGLADVTETVSFVVNKICNKEAR